MSRSSPPVALLLGCLVLVAACASHARVAAQSPTAALRLSAQRDTTLTAADLARLPRTQVRVAASGHAADSAHAQVLYEGVAVADLLALVGAPLGSALRGRAVASYVLVEAADGYRVVFSLEEAGARPQTPALLLADRRDGQALSPEEGPLRIIAPDARHSRWIRQVVRISVRDAAP
jgi:DMSO/TMAO reductase YedYZ molybdopterin-dependent catalytic subunit